MNLNQRLHDTASASYDRTNTRTTTVSRNEFCDLDIAPDLVKAIDRLKFERPTPIQKEAIPVGIRGDDIIAIAQTGSGKTLAFGIPMLQRLSKSKHGTGLVVVPTRELAIQVEESLQAISRPLNIRSTVLIGGASMSLQRNELKKNPRIIIATPGRLMDHIERKTADLSKVEVFVLDEADRMLDMGFIPDIKRIMKSIPDHRQTMLFSATMPKEIEAIAEKLMEKPTRVEIDRSGATPAEVSHEMFIIKKQDKSRLLAVQLNQCSGPVLVFTKTKWMAKRLTTQVNNMGFATAQIHSNRSQGQRRDALEGFKQGRYRILIATDIAARGIDVSGIELVVNYDMPANSEAYVHRIGRTGRAGKTGHAVSFATSDQEGSIRSLERFMKTKLAISTLPILPSEMLAPNRADHSSFRDRVLGVEKPVGRTSSKVHASRRDDFKKSSPRKRAGKRSESTQRGTKPQKSQPAESSQKVAMAERPFRPDFWNHRPARKKAAGHGLRWKSRAKRT